MNYYDTVNKAIENTVVTDSETGVAYLEPRYRSVLEEMNIHLPGHALPGDYKDQELWEILKLEVEKRNAKSDYLKPVLEWCYDTIFNQINPAVELGENELMKDMLEYMQLKNQVADKQKELDDREASIAIKERAHKTVPAGMSFAKKKP